MFFQEAGNWECPPLGATVCVSQTQNAPRLGHSDWNCALRAKFPSIPGLQSRIKQDQHVCLCLHLFLRDRAGRTSQKMFTSGIFRELSPLSVCTDMLCGSNEQPGKGRSLPRERQGLVSIACLLSNWKTMICLFLNSWEKRRANAAYQ